jgi:hypothetical protein
VKKVIAREWVKFVKLGIIGLLLVIVVVLAGEQLQGIEALILGITPYILYQLYCVACWAMKRTKK